ncbi:MAG: hypothetical protein MUF34_26345 [Polyangiaceae bacterium]|nr:hypothetical protein [Polyangiaceae bacterium]
MDDRPLICLVMTTLNDQPALRETIASVRPHVDRYAIVDLGSTDGSQEAARQALEGLEGELVEAKPADFGAAKNQALDLAAGRAVFALVVEAGEVLSGGEILRRFAEANRGATGAHHGAYLLGVQQGSARSDHPRLVRAGAGFRYLGGAYEQLVRDKAPPPSQRVAGALLTFDASRRGPAAQRERWELEVRHLHEDLKKRPKDGHAAFSLGLTYENLGDQRRAYTTFERRTKMGGRQDEVYESFMRMARLTKAANRPWVEAQQLAMSAHSHSPHRAEPLFFLAWHYYERKNWPLTFLFASRGASLPLPERPSLFVEPDVYEAKLDDLVGTSAFYIGEFAAGEASLRRALGRRPGDARLLKNLAFYESRGRKGAGQGQGQPGQGGRRPPRAAATSEGAGTPEGLHEAPAEGEAPTAEAGPAQAAPSTHNGERGPEGGASEATSPATSGAVEAAPTPGPSGEADPTS